MAIRPRSFLRTARGLRPIFVGLAIGAVGSAAWYGGEDPWFFAYCCVLAAISSLASVAIAEGRVARAADDLVPRLEKYPDETLREAFAEIEPTLGPIERDVHEAVLSRLRAVRPGVFEPPGDGYRYPDPTEAARG